ncbi:MAG: hypothetical protein AAGF28_05665 [Pseudomonadota bacterium]
MLSHSFSSSKTRASALSVVSIAALYLTTSLPAHALEGRALFEKLITDAGGSVKWEQISEQVPDSFTATRLTFVNPKGREMQAEAMSVSGLREASQGRVTIDSLSLSKLTGPTDSGAMIINGFVIENGNFPVEIWKDGLTDEERKQRISFGTFAINGTAISSQQGDLTIDTIAMINGDIPLDYRFNNPDANQSEIADPLTFDQFTVSNMAGTAQNDVTWQLGGVSLTDAQFPTAMTDIGDWMQVYSTFSMTGIKVAVAGLDVFGVGSMTGQITPPDAEGTSRSRGAVDGLKINLEAIPDPNSQQVFKTLGYTEVTGSMTAEGSYNPKTGKAVLDSTVLKLKDMADLALSYGIEGYTADVAQAIAQAQAKAGSGTPTQEAFGAILPELSKLKLSNFKLALTDRSLTSRLLDFQAAQMGTTGDQLAAGAPMMIGIGLGQLGMPEFTDMVTKAVGTFLSTKGTLTVEATPSEPVPIMTTVLAGQADPTRIPELINLQITAQ